MGSWQPLPSVSVVSLTFGPMQQGTYWGYPKGVVMSHNDNGGEVLSAQPSQPSLRRHRQILHAQGSLRATLVCCGP